MVYPKLAAAANAPGHPVSESIIIITDTASCIFKQFVKKDSP
jgi:hypothetical protein